MPARGPDTRRLITYHKCQLLQCWDALTPPPLQSEVLTMTGLQDALLWCQTFLDQCKTGKDAELRLLCEDGQDPIIPSYHLLPKGERTQIHTPWRIDWKEPLQKCYLTLENNIFVQNNFVQIYYSWWVASLARPHFKFQIDFRFLQQKFKRGNWWFRRWSQSVEICKYHKRKLVVLLIAYEYSLLEEP